MAERRTRKKAPARTAGPFTVQTFKTIGLTHGTIYRDAVFFMEVATIEGANELAEILNRAAALSASKDLLAQIPMARLRVKIAGAVAKAMGGMIDFDTFRDPGTRA